MLKNQGRLKVKHNKMSRGVSPCSWFWFLGFIKSIGGFSFGVVFPERKASELASLD